MSFYLASFYTCSRLRFGSSPCPSQALMPDWVQLPCSLGFSACGYLLLFVRCSLMLKWVNVFLLISLHLMFSRLVHKLSVSSALLSVLGLYLPLLRNYCS
uniref:Uncharacterized protein n=1 Tax=Anguilla anguilla TaxID=7936 RepID=A0A0E9V7C3_ANGAN